MKRKRGERVMGKFRRWRGKLWSENMKSFRTWLRTRLKIGEIEQRPTFCEILKSAGNDKLYTIKVTCQLISDNFNMTNIGKCIFRKKKKFSKRGIYVTRSCATAERERETRKTRYLIMNGILFQFALVIVKQQSFTVLVIVKLAEKRSPIRENACHISGD